MGPPRDRDIVPAAMKLVRLNANGSWLVRVQQGGQRNWHLLCVQSGQCAGISAEQVLENSSDCGSDTPNSPSETLYFLGVAYKLPSALICDLHCERVTVMV